MFIVYMMHFKEPISGFQHYIGITRAGNLRRRMREHTGQRGAKLTKRYFATGQSAYLVRLWKTPDRKLEVKLKQAGHYQRYCHICNPNALLTRSKATQSVQLTKELKPCNLTPRHSPLSFT